MIHVLNGNAIMSKQDFSLLKSYDSSFPSGVYPGKMWKRFNCGINWLCWYSDMKDGGCEVMRLKIEIGQ